MKKLTIIFMVVIASLILIQPAWLSAGSVELAKVDEATTVLTDIVAIPEKSIPPALLYKAYAVAVIPHVIKAGFIFGGRYGWGILVVKCKDGRWSAPCFVSLMGGSLGWQAGVQSTDVILVFKNKESVDKLARGKFTLGADASIAAGPLGRTASMGVDTTLKAEIYSYSRSRGLFAGLALEGAALQMEYEANEAFYGREDVTPRDIFSNKGPEMPPVAKRFIEVLTKHTRLLA
jgi:lipid-binding SYLF domain-containing protein